MSVRRGVIAVIAAVVATGLVGGCASSATAGSSASPGASASIVKVVASTNVWGNIASTIGGSAVTVTSFISDPSQDPHEYQASSRNQLALSQAQVVIENGGGYDDFMGTMLAAANNPGATVLNAVTISGFTAKDGELNEHVWYDYGTVRKVVAALKDALTKADPAGADTFAANTATFLKGVDGLDASVATLRAKDAGKGAAITEPVPLYLLDAIGLVNKTPDEFSEAIENDTDVSAQVLNETLQLFSGHEVAVLAYNEQTTGAQTDKVLAAAKAAGVPVVPVQETLPDNLTYLTWQAGIITALGTALAQ